MATEPTMSFAALLRRYRAERGLTQEELGERAGLSARGIRALESGERTTPQRDTVRLLGDALGLSGSQRAVFEEVARREGPRPVPVQVEPVAGFLGARPAGPLVGRERELKALVGIIEGVASGQGQLVMLAGEPGIGKTRLAQEVAGQFRKGRNYLDRSRELIDALHDGAEMAWIESNLGEASYLVGDWTDARAEYEEAVRTARRADASMYLSYALLHLAELCAAEGSWDEAQQHIDEGLPIGQQCGAVPAVRKGQRLLAENDLLEGRAERAVNRLQPLLTFQEEDWPRAFPPPVLAEAYLELGDVARAEELVLQRVQRFRTQNHRRALALWLRLEGMILGRRRQWREAQAAFEEAVSIAHSMPYPYAEAHALAEWGRALLSCGDSDRGRTQLERALTIVERLGARPSAERIRQDLSGWLV